MYGGAPQGSPVADRSDPGAPPPAEADAVLGLLGRLRRVIEAAPQAVAVGDEDSDLTALDVAARAAGVLDAVRSAVERLGGPLVRTVEGAPGGPDPVALLHAHRAGAVPAGVGVIASGHPLLALDPRAPLSRLRQVIAAAGVRVVVCDAAHEELAGQLAGPKVVMGRDCGDAPAEALWADAPGADAVAALLPSWSVTGRVGLHALDHRTLVLEAYGRAVVAGGYRAGDRVAQTLPAGSAGHLMASLTALLVGAELRPYDVAAAGADALGDWLEDGAATVLHADPLLLRSLLRAWPCREQFATLRAVLVSGETPHAAEVEPFRGLLPAGCILHHWYAGPDGGLLADHAVDAGAPPVAGVLPAGRPAHDRTLDVVDGQGRSVPEGQLGEITAVCRTRLPSGYWLDPRATAAEVTAEPDGSRTCRTGDVGRIDADGLLHVVGRREHRARIGGHVVDPGETDAALLGLPEVREAVTVGVRRDGATDDRLVAYVVPDADQPSAARLRAALRAVLPAHLVPEAVVYVDGALPRTTDGAIDRSALPPAPPRTAAAEKPLHRWEEMVGEVWASVLELDRVGRNEDFFELGGDSLSAEALISRMITDLGVSEDVCTTSLLVQAPTVAEFAERVRGRAAVRRGPLVPLRRSGRRPPLFIMAGGGGLGIAFVPWARLLGPEQPAWALQSPALEGRTLPDRSVRQAARTRVAAIRRVQPRGPYHLAGHSFGGLLALEAAHQLRAAGEEVALLAIIDTFPPAPSSYPPLPRRPLVQQARDLAGVTLMSVLPTPGGRDHWRFYNQAGRLARRYTCPPWGGRTLVVVADSDERDLRSRWAPHLTGQWRMVHVPGDHLSITRFPWATAVADELRAELDAVHQSR